MPNRPVGPDRHVVDKICCVGSPHRRAQIECRPSNAQFNSKEEKKAMELLGFL